jgi:hypothetical protein
VYSILSRSLGDVGLVIERVGGGGSSQRMRADQKPQRPRITPHQGGTTAEDGEGEDSPFALSFAKRIVEPGVEINKALRFVRQDVLRKTGKQEPFVYGSLPPDDFYFVPPK